MNRSMWHELHIKFFRSGSPALLYIGLNVFVFFISGLAGVIFLLSGNGGWVSSMVQNYFAFPASWDSFPLKAYTLLTYSFFHGSFFHLLFNMLWLYWIGQIFLDFMKPRQFHFVYWGGGILGALIFLLLFHVFPVFSGQNAVLIGASACVMAILVATATLVPDYRLHLLFLGQIRLKYLMAIYIVLDLIGLDSANAGGNMAHLGGALFGFGYVRLLRKGTDLSMIFKRKTKLKVVKNNAVRKPGNKIDQQEIDLILDKISKSGYDKLTKEEKETLFKASKD